MKNLKHIPLQGAYNVRDLGGFPTADGKMTRWGILYRSDALAELTESDWAVLEKRNVKTIIDLRSQREVSSAKITPPEGMEYLNYSLMSELDSDLKSASQEKIIQSMKLDYVNTIYGNLPCVAEILNAILTRTDSGAIVFLCSAGKDRTGMTAALLLYLCRVVKEDIIADYMVSSTYNTNGINRKFSNLPKEYLKLIPDMNLVKELLESKPETMRNLLDALDDRNIRTRLSENGFSVEAQELLADKLTEEI